jgi:hypothetical protein
MHGQMSIKFFSFIYNSVEILNKVPSFNKFLHTDLIILQQGCPTFFGKGIHSLLWAGSRSPRVEAKQVVHLIA